MGDNADFGGSGLCQHGRVRSRCKDCGGNRIECVRAVLRADLRRILAMFVHVHGSTGAPFESALSAVLLDAQSTKMP